MPNNLWNFPPFISSLELSLQINAFSVCLSLKDNNVYLGPCDNGDDFFCYQILPDLNILKF